MIDFAGESLATGINVAMLVTVIALLSRRHLGTSFVVGGLLIFNSCHPDWPMAPSAGHDHHRAVQRAGCHEDQDVSRAIALSRRCTRTPMVVDVVTAMKLL